MKCMSVKEANERVERLYPDCFSSKKLMESYKKWKEFSMNPQTEEDIEAAAIYNEVANINIICYSFVCRYSNLSEDLIKKLMFITSGLFDDDYYDEVHVDAVVDLILCPTGAEQLELKKKLLFDGTTEKGTLSKEFLAKLKTKTITDRLDWFYISNYQKLSPEFKKKFAEKLSKQNKSFADDYSVEEEE